MGTSSPTREPHANAPSLKGEKAEAQATSLVADQMVRALESSLTCWREARDVLKEWAETAGSGGTDAVDPQTLQATVEKVVAERIGEIGEGTSRDSLVEIVNSAVFESGLLERAVTKTVDKLLKQAAGKLLTKLMRDQIGEIVQRQVQKTLSSEQVKMMIDDKFRAICTYLKSDVIPKTVSQTLKKASPPAQRQRGRG